MMHFLLSNGSLYFAYNDYKSKESYCCRFFFLICCCCCFCITKHANERKNVENLIQTQILNTSQDYLNYWWNILLVVEFDQEKDWLVFYFYLHTSRKRDIEYWLLLLSREHNWSPNLQRRGKYTIFCFFFVHVAVVIGYDEELCHEMRIYKTKHLQGWKSQFIKLTRNL